VSAISRYRPLGMALATSAPRCGGNTRSSANPITSTDAVIGFADDLVLPPHLGAEVASAIPNGRYLEIADTGHLGFLERPDAVNAAILDFFANG